LRKNQKLVKIHPVFHISLLKKCEGAPQQQSIPVTLLNDDKGQILQPSIILNKRKIKRNGAWLLEVLM